MIDKKWPKCQTDGHEKVFVAPGAMWSDNHGRHVKVAFIDRDTHDDIAAGIENRWHAAEYTRTDIAEARIAELEAERDTLLRDCWEACGGKGPDSSDDELVGTIDTMRVGIERMRAQRDALRARIDDAPKAYAYGDSSGDPMIVCPDRLRHSTIALVEVND